MDSITILSNEERFTKIIYNGFSILIDDKNYYNASKICSDCGVRFSHISKNKNWIKYLKKISELLKINEEDLIIDKLFNDGYALDIQGLYIHPKLVNYLLFQITLISVDNFEYVILIGEVIEAFASYAKLNNSIIKSKSNRNKYDKLSSEIDNFIVKHLSKFEDGMEVSELKYLYSIYYGSYDSRKFKLFQSKLKEKMIKNGEFRPYLSDGRRPIIYKLKQEFIDLYKNEISSETSLVDTYSE